MKEKVPGETGQGIAMTTDKPLTRREFMSRMAFAGGALVLLSGCSRWVLPESGAKSKQKIYEYIAVDYTKCTGCRTCEAVCSASNHPVSVDGKMIPGIGNPVQSNIVVHSFNPDVSAPAVCARCEDTPCINVCPVDPDPVSGHSALFRDDKWGTITNDPERCVSCGSCVEACSAGGVGILARDPETGRPMRMCTLCDGDPQCVSHCPYEALFLIRVTADQPYYRMAPDEVAKELGKRWYDFSAKGGI